MDGKSTTTTTTKEKDQVAYAVLSMICSAFFNAQKRRRIGDLCAGNEAENQIIFWKAFLSLISN
jgi:hypothetical protein